MNFYQYPTSSTPQSSITMTFSRGEPSISMPVSSPSPTSSVHHMRLALTITHLLLVSLGSVNLLVVLVILVRPYMRSITNVYMISLCLADFIYLINLTLVAASQLNEKSWPFNSLLCTINYRTAIALSLCAWIFAAASASPLYIFAEVAFLRLRSIEKVHKLCIAKWPNSDVARWYITASSILIFALPLAVIIFSYYHIFIKLREALKSCKRMKRGANSRAPYHRVTRLVLWVVIFHVMCWSPFWLFNLFSSIFRLRISTQFDRVVVNIIHLFPYINCALNPILYVAHAENFRIAFRSFFCPKFVNRTSRRSRGELFEDSRCVVVAGIGGGGRSNSMGIGGPGSSVTNGSNPAVILTTDGVDICKNTATFLGSSDRALLTASGPSHNSFCNRTGHGVINLGSVPSLLDCPKLPIRAYSAKHSVITLEECSNDGQIYNNDNKIIRQISRRRRSSAYGNTLSDSEQKAIVDCHNKYRSQLANGKAQNLTGFLPQGMNIKQMNYDNNVESSAAAWAAQCTISHSGGDNGENLFMSSDINLNATAALLQACDMWWSECKEKGIQASLVLDMNEFNKGIGHCTQMAWATTTSIGCAVQRCPASTWKTYLVCQYSPPGIISDKQFTRKESHVLDVTKDVVLQMLDFAIELFLKNFIK
ncbi:G_PROTEIN_RECEP_F1_2 domain-containing protein [Meloidogyne graminicola]|uniref:G_PROTEIN_RECEP_F1_2 domain-containing protein n=1 Tax=Meloidogyne graminicola TaxID=189291 RepID=A0A8S9ZG86_9BILA|nr:G_PROTEIN_RECEP_F1_2 domain-containing protein [Meloidogyne graminicola]